VVTSYGKICKGGIMRKLVVPVTGMAFFLMFFSGDGFSSEPAMPVQSQDMAKDFNKQIVVLRKIKLEYSRARKKEHFRETENNYQWALLLYSRQRWQGALALFDHVADQVADYKSTNQYVRLIKHQITQEKKRQKEISENTFFLKERIIAEVKGIGVLTDLIKRYARLYDQGLLSRDGSQMVSVEKNIDNVYKSLREEKQRRLLLVKKLDLELYVSWNLSRVMSRADKFDQELVSLILAKDYVNASGKINEFQGDMIQKLKVFKETFKNRQVGFINPEKLSDGNGF
jgi:hypothetical protein